MHMENSLDRSPNPEPSVAAFGITHREVDERTCVVAVEGDLDLASAPQLKLALLNLLGKGYGRYVLDLSQLTHMDSMGLGVLVGFHKRLDEDARLALAGVPPKQRKLLELTGLDTRFDSFATIDDALSQRGENGLPFCTDAAMALGLASTAMPSSAGRADRDPVTSVSELAVRVTRKRGAPAVGTGDILVAVMRFYGSDFDLVLAAHGTDRDEVVGRLDVGAAA